MEQTNLKKYFKEKALLINKQLDRYLPADHAYPEMIHQALRYSVLHGGKRFRPILSIATAEMFGKKDKDILPVACAIELIHCYSLIHDDLPCMDNDDYRRGRLTTHRKYNEAIAILTGNSLITIAFEIISTTILRSGNNYLKYKQIMSEIAKASGLEGMVVGQAADLESENKNITKSKLAYIHKHKTGALITASVRVGGILSNASAKQLALLTKYGDCIGLMFQVTDDILDIEGTAEQRGKRIGGDIDLGKATYPKLYGMKQAKKKVIKLIEESHKSLIPFGNKAFVLHGIIDYVGNRTV